MPELRRLLVTPDRLNDLGDGSRPFALNNDEQHYLRRVLRLRHGDFLCVTNGQGRLWMAQLQSDGHLSLINGLTQPMEDQPKSEPSIGLAVALVRRGMDDLFPQGYGWDSNNAYGCIQCDYLGFCAGV